MRRIPAFAFVTSVVAACAACLFNPSRADAGDEPLDPGWQLAYVNQPGYGNSGLVETMFGDGTGRPVVARAYQPGPAYYQQAPARQQRAYRQPAPVYYQQALAPQAGVYQQPAPAPAYYQQVPAPQQQVYQQPAPVYYQQAPEPQMRAYQPAPVYYQQAAAPPARAYQLAPVNYQQAPAQQTLAPQQAPAYAPQNPSRQPSSSAPQYTGSVPVQQARGFQSAPTSYQMAPAPQQGAYQPATQYPQQAPPQQLAFGYPAPAYAPSTSGDMAQPLSDPRYERQVVDFQGAEQPGTIIIDTPHFFLYLIMGGGKALRYGIGVGRPGFTWAGVKQISAMREWPDWYPPVEMIARRPDLPRYMPGGPDNPLGARALYLGSTLYRIHGSNEPWSIGTQVSSGCIRLRNTDIVDLYSRVKVGTKVVVM
jgi:lipoprotein-anchoring transpeptidase ErfK/SrfK